MNKETFKEMKNGSFLINYSRGKLVNIKNLCENLVNKKLLGAALDVFPYEPKSNNEKFISPLTKYNNVILTPHIGCRTLSTQKQIGKDVSNKIIHYLKTDSKNNSINFK
jgi:D-3-phosphoglycerate dehydrogenase